MKMDRRNFFKAGLVSAAGLSYLPLLKSLESYLRMTGQEPLVINAKGVLITDPTRCTGCCRCELACTEFNFGKAHPQISRIKIRRNLNYGSLGLWYGQLMNVGKADQGRIIAETCKQCPHPVPCVLSCPEGAIIAHPESRARFVNWDKCTGCGVCIEACPWDMPAIDPETGKAVTCDLCGGEPECVNTCPTGALRFIKWRDLTKETPVRQAGAAISCKECHE